MKERLIELLLSKSCWNNDCDDELRCENCDCIAVATGDAEKIADYLLANGVIVLPCKIGDTLYDIMEFLDGTSHPEMYELRDIDMMVEKITDNTYVFYYDGCYMNHDDIGKTVFLTKEEAEKALKGRAE